MKADLFFHIFHAHPGSISRNSDAKDLAVVFDLLAGGEDVLHGGGLEMATRKALQNSGKFIPWQVITISIDGNIIE